MTPLNQEQVIQTAQVMLAYLGNPENSTPNDMLEGIVSGKSLLRGIVAGTLVVCSATPQAPAPPAPSGGKGKAPAGKKATPKKTNKNTAPKKAA